MQWKSRFFASGFLVHIFIVQLFFAESDFRSSLVFAQFESCNTAVKLSVVFMESVSFKVPISSNWVYNFSVKSS